MAKENSSTRTSNYRMYQEDVMSLLGSISQHPDYVGKTVDPESNTITVYIKNYSAEKEASLNSVLPIPEDVTVIYKKGEASKSELNR